MREICIVSAMTLMGTTKGVIQYVIKTLTWTNRQLHQFTRTTGKKKLFMKEKGTSRRRNNSLSMYGIVSDMGRRN